MATLSTLPTLRGARRLGDALGSSMLRTLEGEPLLAFLRDQRWFGAKGQRDLAAHVRDVLPIFAGEMDAAMVLVEVANGSAATYQLPLLVRSGDLRTLDDGALAASVRRSPDRTSNGS